MPADHFPAEVAEQLQCYVYLLVDPTKSDEVFYVGKGTGDRVFAHARDALGLGEETPKRARIRSILRDGATVRTELLRWGLDGKTAYAVESVAIEFYGLDKLDNAVGGHGQRLGHLTTDEAIGLFRAEPINVDVPCVLIRPSKLWYFRMPDADLYEATRGWWRIGPRRERAEFACAVSNGIIRGVWKVECWRQRREGDRDWTDDVPGKERWGFDGSIASDLSKRYVGRGVRHYFKPGQQTPFTYVNC